jgi:hypothetical protein
MAVRVQVTGKKLGEQVDICAAFQAQNIPSAPAFCPRSARDP